MSKSKSQVILNLISLEDRTNPAGVGDPYVPPPPPPPVVVVIKLPIVLPPAVPNSVATRVERA